MTPSGAYVHIPFCARKCGYCDFNAYSGYKEGTKAQYVKALCHEIEISSPNLGGGGGLQTVFFGGGTPTQLSAEALAQILALLPLAPGAEVSLEANPADADERYLAKLREAGFNRISFGVQTFNDSLLKLIDREHSGDDAGRHRRWGPGLGRGRGRLERVGRGGAVGRGRRGRARQEHDPAGGTCALESRIEGQRCGSAEVGGAAEREGEPAKLGGRATHPRYRVG